MKRTERLVFLLFSCIFVVNSYVIDDSAGLERRFDGIGGLSGGGATSKLLVNYPEKQRDQILDYLFKPNYGASLQILKVEIGGDSESTDGTESSHMHESWDVNYERGYEWWLMTEAKKRNPNIILYGLPWAFPGWVSGGSGNPYSQPNVTADYIVAWIRGAKQYYHLDIDYIGIWNERNYDITYIKTLRKSLDNNNLHHVKIVASDNKWGIVKAMNKDKELAKVIWAVGVHYPGTRSTPQAVQNGVPLWASEDYSTYNDDIGAGCWARILNQNYVNGYMTSTISWNLIAAYYQHLPFGRDGLMTAQQPWSGYYVVENPIWVSAHTTQFTEVGWTYLKHGSGVGLLDQGGSYVTLLSPDEKDLTMVIETMSHDHSVCIRPALPGYNVTEQTATFTLKGKMATVTSLNVWYSKLSFDGQPDTMFKQMQPIRVVNGSFSLSLGVDEMYTITTMTTGMKGDAGDIPNPEAFPIPYRDDYDAYKEYSEAPNFVPQVGVWEVRDSGDSTHKMVNRQVVLNQPCDWCKNVVPINIGGNYQWTNIYIQADVRVPAVNGSDGVFLAGRITEGGCAADKADGIYFHVFPKMGTYILAADSAGKKMIVQGKQDMQVNTWYSLTIMITGEDLIGFIDYKQVFRVRTPDSVSKNGFVGYGTNRFGLADFDNFVVEEATNYYPVYVDNSL